MMREKAFWFIDEKREEMISLWETLVNMESGSRDKENVDKVAEFLKKTIDAFGGSARILEYPEAGNGIVAEFGVPTNKAHVCFLGHFDTVFPHGTVAARSFRIEDGRAYGPGVLDMKAGVVIQLFVARALWEMGYRDRQIRILLAGDEETGHPRSDMARVFEAECSGAVAAINFETGDVDDALVVGRKGTMAYDIMVKGVAVHAGREPQNGRSAILEMAHKVVDIHALTNYDQGITFNVGTIKGGMVRNGVPDHAEIAVDVRIMDFSQEKEVEGMIERVVSKTYVEGTMSTCIRGTSFSPMPSTEGNHRLFRLVRDISEELGFAVPTALVSGGASDSAYSVKAGVPTIDQMGVKGKWNHSDREYAVVETLFERAKLAVACVLELDRLEEK